MFFCFFLFRKYVQPFDCKKKKKREKVNFLVGVKLVGNQISAATNR